MEEYVRVDIFDEYSEYVFNKISIPKRTFIKLTKKFGKYGEDWYFVSPQNIKVFNGYEWRVIKLKLKKYMVEYYGG
ncbi:MAG: hypothetical protein NC926_11355 [Candidatus Omnitrophica bacterium]|nr:hypothetical protein [Candidatus Omnitrophota bacterium]